MSKKTDKEAKAKTKKLMKRFERSVDKDLCNAIGRIVHGHPGIPGMTSLAATLARIAASCVDTEDNACVLINELFRFAHKRTHEEFQKRIDSALEERAGEAEQ